MHLSIARRPMMAAAFLLFLGACSDVATAPLSQPLFAKKAKSSKKDGPDTVATPVAAPAFVFVSDRSGVDQLYRFRNDSVVRLTFGDLTDTHPRAAAGQVVFTSYRDGDAEIYLADAELTSPKRLTTSASLDDDPALSADGARVAFVSARTGTPRLYVMDNTGANQVAVETGSPSYTPERAPVWSDSGDRIAFTSTRTGTSQVFVVPANGGNAVQLTSEAGGAFDPVWSADGTEITYVAWQGSAMLRTVTIATGAIRDLSTDISSGQPTCNDAACVVVRDPYGSLGDISIITRTGGASQLLIGTAGNDHHPALLK